MKYLIRSELYKIMKQKYFFILMSSATVLGIVTVGLNQSLVNNHPEIVNMGSNVFISSLSNISVSIVLCTIFIHFHIGNEFANRTITMIIESGFSRKKIFLSKVITCGFYCAGLMMMYPLVSSIGTTCLNGWGEKILIVNIFQDVVAFLILNLSILTICITIEFLVESKAISLILNILLIGVGTEILIGISRELPVLEKILDITPIGKVKLIGRTVMKTTDFVTMVVTALIFGGVVLMIGADRFRKSDIK